MKLTSQMLRRIIKEELQKSILKEAADQKLWDALEALAKTYKLADIISTAQAIDVMGKKSSKNVIMMDPEAAAAWRASKGI